MNLDGKFLAGVDEFEQERETAVSSRRLTKYACRVAEEKLAKCDSCKWTIDYATGMTFHIAENPGFADGVIVGRLAI
jgi:hypothetical protein